MLFYHCTIHGSPPNQSDTQRKVVQVSILPKQAPLQIFFQKSPDSPLEIHHLHDDFIFYYNRIREDSEVIPPSPHPAKTLPPFSTKDIILDELLYSINKGV